MIKTDKNIIADYLSRKRYNGDNITYDDKSLSKDGENRKRSTDIKRNS